MSVDAPTTTYRNLIGDRWVDAASGATFESVSPANHEDVVGSFPASGPADVDAAVAAAKAAFPSWSLLPAPKRGEILFKVARLLAEHKEELSRLMTREMGKVLAETRGDVQEAIDVAYYMAGEGRRLFGQTVPSEMPDKFAMAIRRPIGVVGVITPWNFPVAIPAWKLSSSVGTPPSSSRPRIRRPAWCASSSCWSRAACRPASSTW